MKTLIQLVLMIKLQQYYDIAYKNKIVKKIRKYSAGEKSLTSLNDSYF